MHLGTYALKHNFEITDRTDDLPKESSFEAKFDLDHVNNDCEPAAVLYRKGDSYLIRSIWGFREQDHCVVTGQELKALLKQNRDIA